MVFLYAFSTLISNLFTVFFYPVHFLCSAPLYILACAFVLWYYGDGFVRICVFQLKTDHVIEKKPMTILHVCWRK